MRFQERGTLSRVASQHDVFVSDGEAGNNIVTRLTRLAVQDATEICRRGAESLYGNQLTGGKRHVCSRGQRQTTKTSCELESQKQAANENKLTKLPVPLATTPRLLSGMKLAL